jgi:hypothetical protein
MPWSPKVRESTWSSRKSSITEAAAEIALQRKEAERRRIAKEAYEHEKEQRLCLKSQAHSYEKLRIVRQV